MAIGTFATMFWRSYRHRPLGNPYLARAAGPDGPTCAFTCCAADDWPMAILFFWGLARVPLAQAVALAFIAPLIALYLAALILKETIGRRTSRVAGRLCRRGRHLRRPGAGRPRPVALLGSFAILVSAVLYALNIILMRQQALVAGPVEIAFFQNVVSSRCCSGFRSATAVPRPGIGASCCSPRCSRSLADAAVLGLCPGRGRIWRRPNIPLSSGRCCSVGWFSARRFRPSRCRAPR